MRLLQFRIGVGNQGAGLAQSEAPLPKQPLALAYSQANPVAPLDPSTKGFPIPQRPVQAHLARGAAQRPIHLLQLRRTQTLGSSGSFPFYQPGQTPLFKAPNPILHRPWGITQKSTDLRAGHPLRHQQHPMEAMVVS